MTTELNLSLSLLKCLLLLQCPSNSSLKEQSRLAQNVPFWKLHLVWVCRKILHSSRRSCDTLQADRSIVICHRCVTFCKQIGSIVLCHEHRRTFYRQIGSIVLCHEHHRTFYRQTGSIVLCHEHHRTFHRQIGSIVLCRGHHRTFYRQIGSIVLCHEHHRTFYRQTGSIVLCHGHYRTFYRQTGSILLCHEHHRTFYRQTGSIVLCHGHHRTFYRQIGSIVFCRALLPTSYEVPKQGLVEPVIREGNLSTWNAHSWSHLECSAGNACTDISLCVSFSCLPEMLTWRIGSKHLKG